MLRPLATLLLVLLAATGAARAQDAVETIRTAPVVVDGRALYEVRGISGVSAEARAALIRDAIVAAARDPGFDPARMALVPVEGGVELREGGRPVRTIFDADARLEAVDTPVLADAVRDATAGAIAQWRADRSPEGVARAALRALVATALLAALLVGLRLGKRRADRLVERHVESRLPDWERRARDVVRLSEIWRAARRAIAAAFLLLGVIAVVIWLDLILLDLPWTRDVGHRFGALLARPLVRLGEGVLLAIPNLLTLALIVFLTVQAMRLATRFFTAVEARRLRFRGFEPEWSRPTARIARAAILLLGLIMAYPYIPGSSSEAFKAISIFVGVLLSLGATSMIANIVAGNSLIYRRAFHVGDRVEIAGVTGDVEELTAQATYLRTLKNERVTIPNSTVLASQVTNYTSLAGSAGLILHAEVGIGYETPWREVEEMLLAAAARTEGLLAEPRPFVLQKALGDFAPVYEINAYTRDEKAAPRTLTALLASIQDVFAERGVQIMTPHYVGDPPDAKIPPAKIPPATIPPAAS